MKFVQSNNFFSDLQQLVPLFALFTLLMIKCKFLLFSFY